MIKKIFDSDGNVSKWTQINNKVVELMNQACYEEAIPLAVEALKLARQIDQVELIANSYSNLGFLAHQNGNLNEAEDLYLQALELNRNNAGSSDLSVAMVLGNLALLKYSQGFYEQAISYYQQVIEIKTAKLAFNHPSLLKSVQNLVDIYMSLGQESEAEKLYNKFK